MLQIHSISTDSLSYLFSVVVKPIEIITLARETALAHLNFLEKQPEISPIVLRSVIDLLIKDYVLIRDLRSSVVDLVDPKFCAFSSGWIDSFSDRCKIVFDHYHDVMGVDYEI